MLGMSQPPSRDRVCIANNLFFVYMNCLDDLSRTFLVVSGVVGRCFTRDVSSFLFLVFFRLGRMIRQNGAAGHYEESGAVFWPVCGV